MSINQKQKRQVVVVKHDSIKKTKIELHYIYSLHFAAVSLERAMQPNPQQDN